jgi:hypothetical protein
MGFLYKEAPPAPPKPQALQEDPAAAKRRVQEEAKKIQEDMDHKRVALQKVLIGEQAESVGDRKQGVAQSLKGFNKKDTTTHVDTSDIGLEVNSVKHEFTNKYEMEQNVPTLFQGQSLGAPQVTETPLAAPALSISAEQKAALEALRPKGWDGQTYHSLVDLRQRRVQGIDMKNREQYLSPDEFQNAFDMTKEEFAVCSSGDGTNSSLGCICIRRGESCMGEISQSIHKFRK